MSHVDVASVWRVLYGCPDIDNVLRELMGHHALDVSLNRNDNLHLCEATFAHILALKVIFDLQRTYLQPSVRSKESNSSLLQHGSLFSAVLYLLDILVAGISTGADLAIEGRLGSLAGKTLLSGLRALLLLGVSLPTRQHKLLRRRFEEVYQHETWGAPDDLIKSLCLQTIQALAHAGQDDRYSKPACGIASLPDFFSSQRNFEFHKSSIVEGVQQAEIISTQSQSSLRDCLALYDLHWCTTAAMIQLCLIRKLRQEKRQQWPHISEDKELNELRQILIARFQIYQHVSSGLGEEDKARTGEQIKSLLDHGLSTTCMEDQCMCFDHRSLNLQDLRSQCGIDDVSATAWGLSSQMLHTPEIDNALQDLQLYLENRLRQAAKPRFELQNPSTDRFRRSVSSQVKPDVPVFQRAATTPAIEGSWKEGLFKQHRPSLPDHKSSPDRSTTDFYQGGQRPITETPEPPIDNSTPTIALNDRGSSFSPDQSSIPDTTGTSEVFSSRSPPQSSTTSPRPQHRKLEQENLPEVYHISVEQQREQQREQHETRMRHSVSVNLPERRRSNSITHSRDIRQPHLLQPDLESFPEVAHSNVLSVAPSVMSNESDRNPTVFSPDLSASKPKKLRDFFKSNRTALSSSIPTAAFFASGRNLLIWNERGAGYYNLDNLRSISFQRITTGNVSIAAGGSRLCAIVTKGTVHYRLEVYESPSDAHIRSWKLTDLPCAIALSQNDNYVALKFSLHVNIYDITTSGSFHHQLPPVQNNRSGLSLHHLVAFSTDSLSFVASTRYEPEKVITYWSECHPSPKATHVESTAPTGYAGDDGLSALVCSKTALRSAFLTTFTEKGFPAFLSLASSRISARTVRDSKGRIGTRIHSAAIDPSGTNLVLMNQRNEVYWLEECFTGLQEWRRVGKIERSKSITRDVELGMPNSDEVHVFWIEKGRGMLVRMGKGGGMTKTVELVIDMEVLVTA